MLKHAFSFGTAMQAALVSDTSGTYQAYQDFFYNNFNYAVLENALKWKQMEPNQVSIHNCCSMRCTCTEKSLCLSPMRKQLFLQLFSRMKLIMLLQKRPLTYSWKISMFLALIFAQNGETINCRGKQLALIAHKDQQRCLDCVANNNYITIFSGYFRKIDKIGQNETTNEWKYC